MKAGFCSGDREEIMYIPLKVRGKMQVVIYEGKKPSVAKPKDIDTQIYVDLLTQREADSEMLEIVYDSNETACRFELLGYDDRYEDSSLENLGVKKDKIEKGDRFLTYVRKKQSYVIAFVNCANKKWVAIDEELEISGPTQLVISSNGKTKVKARNGFKQKVIKKKVQRCQIMQQSVVRADSSCDRIANEKERSNCKFRTIRRRNLGGPAEYCSLK